jgi:hypothetical protein
MKMEVIFFEPSLYGASEFSLKEHAMWVKVFRTKLPHLYLIRREF